jgi:cytochrome c-type biogenesis protein CcmE
MKLKYALGVIVIAVCVGVGFFALRSAMTPYVPFAEAMAARGRDVQVIGTLVKGATEFDDKTNGWRFRLKDAAGTEMAVETRENLPANFEHSNSVVAIGSYADGRFEAKNILVKCPSKYEKKAREQSSENRPSK